MHTTKIKNISFLHDGFSPDGRVSIIKDGVKIETEMEYLLDFVAQVVQYNKITKLELADTKEILGL